MEKETEVIKATSVLHTPHNSFLGPKLSSILITGHIIQWKEPGHYTIFIGT